MFWWDLIVKSVTDSCKGWKIVFSKNMGIPAFHKNSLYITNGVEKVSTRQIKITNNLYIDNFQSIGKDIESIDIIISWHFYSLLNLVCSVNKSFKNTIVSVKNYWLITFADSFFTYEMLKNCILLYWLSSLFEWLFYNTFFFNVGT